MPVEEVFGEPLPESDRDLLGKDFELTLDDDDDEEEDDDRKSKVERVLNGFGGRIEVGDRGCDDDGGGGGGGIEESEVVEVIEGRFPALLVGGGVVGGFSCVA